MKGYRPLWRFVLPALLLTGATSTSWAWRGGFGGPRVGIYLGPGPYGWGYPDTDPYYDPYYYDPYNSPTVYDPAYAPVAPAYSQPQRMESSLDDSRHDLEFLNEQIARARDSVDYEYSDGDISKTERKAEIHRLYLIEKEARMEAKLNGGYLTAEQQNELLHQLHSGTQPPEWSSSQEPRSSSGNSEKELQPINNRIEQLRKLLDKKLVDKDITQAQHDGMTAYLARIDKQVRSDASANEGRLTADQQSAVQQQLERAEDSITKNFVVN